MFFAGRGDPKSNSSQGLIQPLVSPARRARAAALHVFQLDVRNKLGDLFYVALVETRLFRFVTEFVISITEAVCFGCPVLWDRFF